MRLHFYRNKNSDYIAKKLSSILKKINIAIDGHSSCGKGTLAKHLAKELNYLFIDSGAMYRAVTLYMLQNEISIDTIKRAPDLLQEINISFRFSEKESYYYTFMNDINIEKEIRGMEVSKFVSPVSRVKEVRDFLVSKQQIIGAQKGVVMDGRDIGTVVFPDAELKIFMTAEPEIRAKRRFLELSEKGYDSDYDEILQNIKERDRMDTTRENSPLTKADDAITLNNTDMTKMEQARLALTWARGVIASL